MYRLNWDEIETNAIAFARRWKDSVGDERQEANTFEKDFVSVFGVDWHEGLHEYQIRDMQGKIGYIDYLLPCKILIEMKSKGESLIRAYNQGYDYLKCLKPEEYPELLMVSDFDYIQVTNLRTMQSFKKFKINQLKNHIRMFGTLAGYNSEVTFKTDIEVNTDASYKMAKLHDRLKESGYVGQDLEQYLVRILFCLFAEDTGIFDEKAFEDYIKNSKIDGTDLSARMMLLFDTLNTDKAIRMKTLPEELKKFRYINGGLFAKQLPPAYFDTKMRQTIIECCDFDWSYISPAIFGAMFQGVMDEKQRRKMGAHYTSEENILKLIKPLFLDDLWEEFESKKSSVDELKEFHIKLSKITILDPACGCGNFLIITYRELRLLEFELLKMLIDNKQTKIIDTICKISIEQFYGIEYEEFPCQIAQVGMLLMKHQMDKEVSNYFGMNFIDFPIRENANIIHGNSLRIDWEDVVSKFELSYIIGNPPFLGFTYMNQEQKEDMSLYTKSKSLDYVTGWYLKASEYIKSTNIKVAYVSTNSITQGEPVDILWNELLNKYKIDIIFAYRTFIWNNNAKGKAAVHCVIIGFQYGKYLKDKYLFDGDNKVIASNINPYLVDAPNIIVKSRNKPISDLPEMHYGNKIIDDGNLIIENEEYKDFLIKEPQAEKYIKKFVGSKEFINNLERYILDLQDVTPSELKKCPEITKRVNAVRKFRLNSPAESIRKKADSPTLFGQITRSDTSYIIVPCVSSEKRKYVPIGFVNNNVVASNAVQIIPNATLYHFGLLTSNVHMAWMRAVCGRLKSDYRYGKDVVYNTFPCPQANEKQKVTISLMAQKVLEVREQFSDCTLAELYNPIYMPSDLLKAHQNLDREVCRAYGTIWKTEMECVSDLMKLYQLKIEELKTRYKY
jgi:hypothetical protein